jgi:hypothetical protein
LPPIKLSNKELDYLLGGSLYNMLGAYTIIRSEESIKKSTNSRKQKKIDNLKHTCAVVILDEIELVKKAEAICKSYGFFMKKK